MAQADGMTQAFESALSPLVPIKAARLRTKSGLLSLTRELKPL